ncbi:MAG: Fur family transcriptional regulator [Prevotellaceae bacterium]|nr:Fur family transcriptional regulator [Prevotellaceae bacterium]
MEKEEAIKQAKAILDGYLEMNNHRKTPERYAILDAVASMDAHFTLDQLGGKLSSEFRFPVSRATLYNTLNLFVKLRIVIRHRLASTTTYEFSQSDGHNVHQVCTTCGKVTSLKSQEIDEAINALHLKRFKRDGYAVYVYGICSACQAKITRGKKTK